MAGPSRSRSRSDVPVSLRNRSAASGRPREPQQPRRALDPVDDIGADHPLRRAVERGGDDGVEHRGRRVAVLHHRRHVALLGEQEAGAHGDAVGAVGERGDEAAARRGSRRRRAPGSPRRPRRRPGAAAATWGPMPVWPPPSPPWAMTASTPISSTFSAWRRAPDGRHDDHAGVVAAGHGVLASGAPAKDTSRTPSADHERHPLGEVGLVGAEVDAERRRRCAPSPRAPPSASASASSSRRRGSRTRRRRWWRRSGWRPTPTPCPSARSAAGTPPARRTASAAQGAADLTLRQITGRPPPPANRP